ncbi:hypothetical protein HK100_011620 [Physocladia obscura]|uniref:Uncharacterized protein n=1 Tax=Physocladia obscura TaxID=109957 RepID=A0AAD5T1W2_9FUNG|nr:hypothetical protein HK100_011620 [Physocladia obscura]
MRLNHNQQQKTLPVWGIGDVATAINHRGKGLAKRLLALADTFMATAVPKRKLAVLHASELGVPVYKSVGWQQCEMQMVSIATRAVEISNGSCSDGYVCDIDFNDAQHLSLVKACHDLFAASFIGSFLRVDGLDNDDFYWKNYVGTQNDPRPVTARILYTSCKTQKNASPQIGDTIGYIICEAMRFDLKNTPPNTPIKIQVKDLCVAKISAQEMSNSSGGDKAGATKVLALSPPEFFAAISILLETAIAKIFNTFFKENNGNSDNRGFENGTIQLMLNFSAAAVFPPALIDSLVKVGANWLAKENRLETTDSGWMFKFVEGGGSFEVAVAGRSGEAQTVVVGDIEALRKALGPVSEGCEYGFQACNGVVLQAGAPTFGFYKSDAF